MLVGTVCNSAPWREVIASGGITLPPSDGEHRADEILIEQLRLAGAFENRVGER